MTFSLGSTPRSLVKYNDQSISAITEVGSGAGVTDDMVLIKEVTASSDSTIDFVDGTSDVVLDSTYPIYLFKFINIHNQTSAKYLQFNVSIDGGSNYNVAKTSTHFRAYQYENDGGTALEYSGGDDLAQGTGAQHIGQDIGVNNDDTTAGFLHLFNPSDTTFVKHFIARTSNCVSTPTAQDAFTAGYINTTSAVDAIQFSISSGNMDAGDICLYGIA